MLKVECYVNGTYRGVVELPFSREHLESVIDSLQDGQNCVISYNRTKVYNSSMTPLYTNGEIKIAERYAGKIDRRYTIVN